MSVNSISIVSGTPPFALHDGEAVRYSSPTARQLLLIELRDASHAIHISANDGSVFLTNRRLVYVTASQGDISTFLVDLGSAPALHFSHEVKLPWFGANYWEFLFCSLAPPPVCDGFPRDQWFRGSLKFSDGGMFDFVRLFNSAINDAVNNGHIDEELPRYSV